MNSLNNINSSSTRALPNKLSVPVQGCASDLPTPDADDVDTLQANGRFCLSTPPFRRYPLPSIGSPLFPKVKANNEMYEREINKLKEESEEWRKCIDELCSYLDQTIADNEQLKKQAEGLKAKLETTNKQLDARQKQIKQLEIALEEKNSKHAQKSTERKSEIIELTNELAKLKKEKDAESARLASIKMEIARMRERLKLAESERATKTDWPTANEASTARSNTSGTQNLDLQNLEVKTRLDSLRDEINARQLRVDRLQQARKNRMREDEKSLARDRERPTSTLAEDSKGKRLHDKKQSQAESTALAGHSPSLPTKKHNIDSQTQQHPKPKAEINASDHDLGLQKPEARALFHRLHDEFDAQQLELKRLQKAIEDQTRKLDKDLARDRERLARLKNKNPSSESRKDWERSICYVV